MPSRFQSNKSIKAALNSAGKEIGDSIKNGAGNKWTRLKKGAAGKRDSALQKFGIVNLRTAPKISYAIRGAACSLELKKFATYTKDYRRFVKICGVIDDDLSGKNDNPDADALLPTPEQVDRKIKRIESQIKDKEKEITQKGGKPDEKKARKKEKKRDKKLTPKDKKIEDLKDEIIDLEEELEALEKLKKGGAARSKKLVENFKAAMKPLGSLGTSFAGHKSKINKYKGNLDAKREEISNLTDEGKAERVRKSLENFSKSFYVIHKDKFFKEYEKIAEKVFDSIIELKKAVEANDKKLVKPRDYFHLVSIQKELFAVGDAKKEYAELDQFVKMQIKALNKKTWNVFRKTEDGGQ